VKLLQVPCDADTTSSAPNIVSTIHCDVSTLPATTAAGYFGFNMLLDGILISIGTRHPLFNGMFLAI
jgi:hypothetical protein